MNHDRIKLCKDRNLSDWIQKHLRKIPLDTSNGSNKFCICHGLDTGSFMIQCDECRDWFHAACVNVTKEYAEKNLRLSVPGLWQLVTLFFYFFCWFNVVFNVNYVNNLRNIAVLICYWGFCIHFYYHNSI